MDEDQAREYSERMEEESKLSAEEKARQLFEDSLEEDEDQEEQATDLD